MANTNPGPIIFYVTDADLNKFYISCLTSYSKRLFTVYEFITQYEHHTSRLSAIININTRIVCS